MRKYQLEGLQWMTSLYENGLNGILADKIGLIQVINWRLAGEWPAAARPAVRRRRGRRLN